MEKKQYNPIRNLQEGVNIPHSDDLERDVLGTLIFLGENAIDDVQDIISPKTFYNEKNAIVYSEILRLVADSIPLTAVNMVDKMRSDGTLEKVGGATFISSLISSVHTTTNLVRNAQLIHQYEMSRELCYLCDKGIAMVSDSSYDIGDIMETIEKGLTELQTNTGAELVTFDEALNEYYKHIMKLSYEGVENSFIKTGFNKLDDVLCGGFHKSDLIVFGGRPGNGKTAISLHFARHAAEQGKKVMFVNIEMTTNNLIARMASNGIPYNKLRNGDLTEQDRLQLERNLSDMQNYPIMISSSCNSFSGIVSAARKLKRKQGLDMLIIDYLQLIELNLNFERQQLKIGYMTRRLKALAKELDIPILLLSQLSRPERGQELRPPRLEHLRESGDIEQDADIVIFTHRPSENDVSDDNRSFYGRGKLIVAKNREGERDVDVIYCHDPYFKVFVDDGNDYPEWQCGKPMLRLPTNQEDDGRF